MKIDKGSRVGIIENGKIVKGTVKEVYLEVGYAVVEFDCGDVKKVLLSNLAVLPEESREPTEPVEKSEITITPEEFREISCSVIAKKTKNNLALGLLMDTILAEIHGALFFEGDND